MELKKAEEPDKPTEEATQETKIDYVYKNKLSSDTLYVKKVDNLSEDFILGMDLSSLISEENSGVKYYNFEGEEKILSKYWDMLELITLELEYGMTLSIQKVMDMEVVIMISRQQLKSEKEQQNTAWKFWHHIIIQIFMLIQGSQNVPKAWVGLTLEEKAKKAEEFTKETLTRFKNEGIDIGMVALGN